MATTFRRLGRLIHLGWVTGTALVEYPFSGADRGRWLQRAARRVARVLCLRMTVVGRWARTPLVAANHVSYLDIVALAAIAPVRFVAKAEVRHWPVFGWCARCGDTIFVARQDRRQLAAVNTALRAAADAGDSVVLFPEGTSTDGTRLLPFRSSLLAAAAEGPLPVLPVWLGYAVAGCDAARDVCWWGDMTLAPHLWRLLSFDEIQVTIRFGPPVRHWDRKELAAHLEQAVNDLAHPTAVGEAADPMTAECV